MGTMQCELPKASLWPEYRRAFDESSQKVRHVQSLTSHLNPNPHALGRASRELEQARMMYNCRRDALVRELLPVAEPAGEAVTAA